MSDNGHFNGIQQDLSGIMHWTASPTMGYKVATPPLTTWFSKHIKYRYNHHKPWLIKLWTRLLIISHHYTMPLLSQSSPLEAPLRLKLHLFIENSLKNRKTLVAGSFFLMLQTLVKHPTFQNFIHAIPGTSLGMRPLGECDSPGPPGCLGGRGEDLLVDSSGVSFNGNLKRLNLWG